MVIVLVLLQLNLLLSFNVFFLIATIEFVAYPWAENRRLLLFLIQFFLLVIFLNQLALSFRILLSCRRWLFSVFVLIFTRLNLRKLNLFLLSQTMFSRNCRCYLCNFLLFRFLSIFFFSDFNGF